MLRSKQIVGFKEVKREIMARRAQRVFLAKDADWSIRLVIEELCDNFSVDIHYVLTKEELGKQMGINVPAATAAYLI